MKKLIAALTIAAAPVIGFAGIANAAPQDQPWGQGSYLELPDGTCLQPMSNPPLHVDCATTRATTPYVSGERFDDDPVSTSPPDQYNAEAAAAPAAGPSPKRSAVKRIEPIVVDAAPWTWVFQHGQ